MNKVKLTSEHINFINLTRCCLSHHEFSTLCKFYHSHASLSIEELEKALSVEFPELYDKIINRRFY